MDKFLIKRNKPDSPIEEGSPQVKKAKISESKDGEIIVVSEVEEVTTTTTTTTITPILSPSPKVLTIPAECIMAHTLSDPNWRKLLAGEFAKPYYKQIEKLVAEQRKVTEVYPPVEEVFAAFNRCPLEKVRIVIIGQDPYFSPGQAEGLCFSVKKGIAIPASLRRIHKVLEKTIPGFKIPKHGSLVEWADRGVLMLNATLTVNKGDANSHAKFGWQDFTSEVMRILNRECKGLIYLLWGGFAQKKGKVIDTSRHTILEAAHPSPLGGASFNDCKHFTQVNEMLKKAGKEPMDWTIS